MKTANEILNQLGGSKFIAMTGVTNLVGDENSLTMKLRTNQAKATWMRVTLTSLDLYTVEFINRRFENVKMFEGVYNDMLRTIFENVTGYRTSL